MTAAEYADTAADQLYADGTPTAADVKRALADAWLAGVGDDDATWAERSRGGRIHDFAMEAERLDNALRVLGVLVHGRPNIVSMRDLFEAVKGRPSLATMGQVRLVFHELERRGYCYTTTPDTSGPGRPPSPTIHMRVRAVRDAK